MRCVDDGMAVEQSITTRARPQALQHAPGAGQHGFDLRRAGQHQDHHVRACSHLGGAVQAHGTGGLQRVQRLVAWVLEHRQRMAVLDDVAGDAVAHQADAHHADVLLHRSLLEP
jgi:hypothetical protein